MIDVPQIPVEFLIHSVDYHEYEPGGRYGESWKAPVVLERVRIEPMRKLIRGANGDQVTSVATLFVVAPDPLYTFDPLIPHHWEIALE